MCVPTSFMVTHGEPEPQLSTANLAHASFGKSNYEGLCNELRNNV